MFKISWILDFFLGPKFYFDSGDSTPDKTTQTQELPEWARGYAKDTLAKASALTDINQNPYQEYGGQRIAGFDPMQQQSFQNAANMQPSQQVGLGSGIAGAAGMGALGTGYQAGQFSNQFQNPGQYQPGQFSMLEAQGQNLQNYQMGPAERVRSRNFDSPSAQQYMSPYTQNVVDYQKSQAIRDFQVAQPGRNAQAVQQGAFGGSRSAIVDAEAQRNLSSQLQGIEATGQQQAYQNAQQQFNADQTRRMQAQQANQQAGLTVGGQNLSANLGVQQLGAGQNMQAQLANQQAYQQAQTAAEQSRQYGAGQGLQAAGLGAQYGQSAQQLEEQSRQYGADLGMKGLSTGLQAASTLGQLGQTQYGQEMGINALQNQYGAQQQQQAQRGLDTGYQDFLNQQNYPYKQLGFMSDMVRGLPLGQQSTASIYSQGPSAIQTLAGLGGAAYGFGNSGMFGGSPSSGGKSNKEGGLMESYADGGVTSDQNVESILTKLSDQQLAQAKETALNRRDLEEVQMIDAEMAERASIRGGLGGAFNQIPVEQQEQMMAGGGMVAFAPGGAAKSKDTYGNRFEQSLTDLKAMANQAPAEPTPEQRDEDISARIPLLEKRYGPDITKPYLEETKTKRAGLADQMEKDKGLAFAMSSLKLLSRNKKPGENQKTQFISGLGEAGEAFIGEVGRLKKENREFDDKLRQSEILLATAQQSRKEGLINKADAEETRAQDLKKDAFKTKIELQGKVAQLTSGLAQQEMQGENALRVAGITAAAHRDVANKPSQMERMMAEADLIRTGKKSYNGKTGEDGAKAYIDTMRETGAAMYGSKYTGADKSVEQATAITDKAMEAATVKALEMPLLQARQSGDPVKIKTAEDNYNRALRAAEQEIIDQAARAEAKKREARTGNVPGGTATPSRSGRNVSLVGQPPSSGDVSMLKSAPSAQNRAYFDETYGPGAAAKILGN